MQSELVYPRRREVRSFLTALLLVGFAAGCGREPPPTTPPPDPEAVKKERDELNRLRQKERTNDAPKKGK